MRTAFSCSSGMVSVPQLLKILHNTESEPQKFAARDVLFGAVPVIPAVVRSQILCRGCGGGKVVGRDCGAICIPTAGVGKGYARQGIAIPERRIADGGDGVSYRYARQGIALPECIRADGGDGVRNCKTRLRFANSVSNQYRTIFRTEISVNRLVCNVIFIDYNTRQGRAICKRPLTDGGDGVGNRYARQGIAITERRIADGGDGVGDRYARKLEAICECPIADGGDGVGDRYARQSRATFERIIADGSDGIGDRYARQGITITERIIADGGDGTGDRYARQGIAIIERIIADGGDGIGDRYARQGIAIIERIIADGNDGVGNYKTRLRFTNRVSNQYRTIFRIEISVNRLICSVIFINYNVRQGTAIIERHIADGGDGVAYRYACQGIAIPERRIADGGDGAAYRYARQGRAITERPLAYGGDFVAIDVTTDIDIAIGTSTNTCNGAGFSIIVYLVGKTLTCGERFFRRFRGCFFQGCRGGCVCCLVSCNIIVCIFVIFTRSKCNQEHKNKHENT